MTNNKKNKPLKSVSIVTITQLKRSETIKVTLDIIKRQTYKNIIQWTIVEGSSNEEDGVNNSENIKKLKELSSVPITYIEYSGCKLGELRNMGNKACTGDITVCMDDDDYYPPTRVEHVVEQFKTSKFLIAGCSEKYLYDYCLKKFYKFKQFGPYHSTNDCMAWKKEYLLTHSHDPNAINAEEASFTNKFTEPMIQLDSKQVIISSSHHMNTFNKKEILILTTLGHYKFSEQIDENEVLKIMDNDLFERYKAIYDNKDKESKYDVVFYTGGLIIWDPENLFMTLREHEYILEMTNYLKNMGKKVAVYGKIIDGNNNTSKTFNGIDYIDWREFNYSGNYNTVIIWRVFGLDCVLQYPFKAKHLYVDLHDNYYDMKTDFKKYRNKIDKLLFKSDFQKIFYENHFKEKLNNDEYFIVPNGIKIQEIKKYGLSTPQQRNPFRFCYNNCYTKGLDYILTSIWPIIYKMEPRAEFHIYGGINNINDQNYKQNLLIALSQPGVMDHGKVEYSLSIREKYLSTFELYITDSHLDVDIVSIKESILCGCIPLISKYNIFGNNSIGINFNLIKGNNESNFKIAEVIINLINKPEFLEMCRNKFITQNTIFDWNQTCEKLIDNLNLD